MNCFPKVIPEDIFQLDSFFFLLIIQVVITFQQIFNEEIRKAISVSIVQITENFFYTSKMMRVFVPCRRNKFN